MVKTATQIEQIKQMAKSLRLTLISEDLEMMLHEADDAHIQFGVETSKHSSHQNGCYGRSFSNAKDIGGF